MVVYSNVLLDRSKPLSQMARSQEDLFYQLGAYSIIKMTVYKKSWYHT